MNNYRHLFGPVPARRLGRSLGGGLASFKTCTLDCIFCQLGHTKHKTLDRKEYVPVAEIRSGIRDWIEKDGQEGERFEGVQQEIILVSALKKHMD